MGGRGAQPSSGLDGGLPIVEAAAGNVEGTAHARGSDR